MQAYLTYNYPLFTLQSNSLFEQVFVTMPFIFGLEIMQLINSQT